MDTISFYSDCRAWVYLKIYVILTTNIGEESFLKALKQCEEGLGVVGFPTLSIIVPTYNRSVFLKECLESILLQNYPALEIVVTDDHSTDGTEVLIKSLINKYPNILYVKNERYPKGPNGNKNNGLDFATGKILGIFDDDDTMPKNALLPMVEKILEGYDMVMGNCRIVSNDSRNGKFAGRGLNKNGVVSPYNYLCGKVEGEFWGIFRRELLGNKRFDTALYGGEGTLWRGMYLESKTYYIHMNVRNYRIHGNNISDFMTSKASQVIKNYEKDIELYGQVMEKHCPCYLASIYKGAAYFAKLSGQYKKGFNYILTSLKLCLNKEAIMMFIAMFIPRKFIPFVSKIRSRF